MGEVTQEVKKKKKRGIHRSCYKEQNQWMHQEFNVLRVNTALRKAYSISKMY